MIRVGLTVGIASGKSTVAGMLAELGAVVIDADKVGHEVYLPGTEGFRRVVDAFGREIVASDGTIDRRRLGERVFAEVPAGAELATVDRLATGPSAAAVPESAAGAAVKK